MTKLFFLSSAKNLGLNQSFAEEEGEGSNGKVVKQQEHKLELDLARAGLCADVKVEFFEPQESVNNNLKRVRLVIEIDA